MKKQTPAKDVDSYIAAAPRVAQPRLREVRDAIRDVAPDAVESISYGMPFYSFRGEVGIEARLCYFGLHKDSIGFYMRPHVIEEHKEEAAEYKTTKSALRFSLDEPIPVSLIKNLVRDAIRRHSM
ncbi:MAG: DUF1801 domain-containing protein [Thaumarchaeota archaeon]|nr:DUF1801 domain-containing protein [Nitrososphaerota archaeon]